MDGVGVLGVLQLPSGPELVLQKQFRPPVGKVCIEIPAGLLDAGESVEQCAVRELHEETGYRGVAIKMGEGMTGAEGLMFNGK